MLQCSERAAIQRFELNVTGKPKDREGHRGSINVSGVLLMRGRGNNTAMQTNQEVKRFKNRDQETERNRDLETEKRDGGG
jgi:hypothetical protein